MTTLEQGLQNLSDIQDIERQIRRLEVRAAYEAQWHATRAQRRYAHNRGMALAARNQNAFDIGEDLAKQIYWNVQRAMPRRDMSQYEHVPTPEIKELLYKKYCQFPVAFPGVGYDTLDRMVEIASRCARFYTCDLLREEIKRRDAIHNYHEMKFNHLEELVAGGNDDAEIKADHTYHFNAMNRVLKTGYELVAQMRGGK